MAPWLLWLEGRLREQRDITSCLLLAGIQLPLYLVFLSMPVIAGSQQAYQHIYQWDVVHFTNIVVGASALGLMAIALFCWGRRGSDENYPWLSLVTVVISFVAAVTLSIGYGYRDSPIMLLCLGMVLLVRALFKPDVYKPISVVVFLVFVCVEIGFWTHAVPYAPMLQTPIVSGQPLAEWWSFWLRIIYAMTALPLMGIFVALGYFMAREKQELERLVITDSLTGLFNRSYFMGRMELEGRRLARAGKPMCLLMCDVDNFKQVNDTRGHPMGDEVLQAVGRVLKLSTRAGGDLVARFGGEEFVVLLPEARLSQAERVAEKIRNNLAQQYNGGELEPFLVTMSIGIVQVNDGDGELAIRVADDNLYRAKRAGKNQVVSCLAHQHGSLECV